MQNISKLFEQLANDLQQVNAPVPTHRQIQNIVAQYKQQAEQGLSKDEDE